MPQRTVFSRPRGRREPVVLLGAPVASRLERLAEGEGDELELARQLLLRRFELARSRKRLQGQGALVGAGGEQDWPEADLSPRGDGLERREEIGVLETRERQARRRDRGGLGGFRRIERLELARRRPDGEPPVEPVRQLRELPAADPGPDHHTETGPSGAEISTPSVPSAPTTNRFETLPSGPE